MNFADFWPMAREYFIWNAAVAVLQLWTVVPKDHVLSSAIEQVFNAYFYPTSTHLLCHQSEEYLFIHFVTMFNAAFESKFALEDKCYDSGSENFNILTPLQCTPRIHHVSSDDKISFDLVFPCSMSTRQSDHKPVQCQLSFNTPDDEDSSADDIPPTCSTTSPQNLLGFTQLTCYKPIYTTCDDLEENEEEEDLQRVPLEDDHWTTEEISDKHLCIHKHSVSHSLCPYPCPYMDYTSTSYQSTMDLGDISEFEDLMTTSSDEDIPGLDDEIGY